VIKKLLLIGTLAIAGSVCTIPAAKAQQILPKGKDVADVLAQGRMPK